MKTFLTLVLSVTALSGCGLAGTAATTGASAESAAEQAREAKQLEDHVKQQINALQQQAGAQRDQAEKDAQ